jgi:hypothetical protein
VVDARAEWDRVSEELERGFGNEPHLVSVDQLLSFAPTTTTRRSWRDRTSIFYCRAFYRNRSRLVVVFLSEAYENKPWCSGVEFRAIRDIIKSRDQQRIMFVRMDDGVVEGTFSLDGAIDARQHTPQEVARMISALTYCPNLFLCIVRLFDRPSSGLANQTISRKFSPTSVHERPNTTENRGEPDTREQDDSTTYGT